ncbi:hypothetical protein ACRQU7_01440 [Caproiciproducens sp. R1]|uniref:hypothetical protein n=1 Tax=Acutalibacteraceae TaxID=3082771 RepID=UPI002E0FD6DC
MFLKEWKRSMRDMFLHREFYFALLTSMLVLLGSFFLSLLTFYHVDWIYVRPAWSYWGYQATWFRWSDQKGSMGIAAISTYIYVYFLLPLLAALAYSYAHFDNYRLDVHKILLPREGRAAYYRANGLSVFLSGFLVVAAPLLLQQVALIIAMPYSVMRNMGSTLVVDDYATQLLHISGLIKFLQIGHPYLFNILTSFCMSVTAGITALCSYSFSLYFQRNRFIAVLLLPILLWLVLPICLARAFQDNIASYAWIGIGGDYIWWLVETSCILLIDIFCIEWKIHYAKDELGC